MPLGSRTDFADAKFAGVQALFSSDVAAAVGVRLVFGSVVTLSSSIRAVEPGKRLHTVELTDLPRAGLLQTGL